VRDQCGLAVSGAEVVLSDGAGREVHRLRTDERAGFLRPEGAFTARVTREGYAAADFPLAASGESVVVLVGTGKLSGQVVDEAGRAVAGARVEATPVDTSGLDRPGISPTPWTTETGADGTFELERVPPRLMRLVATFGATATQRAGRAEAVTAVPAKTDLRLELSAWNVVAGRLLDASGEPLVNANIAIRARGPDGSAGRVWSASTGEDGSFLVEGVEAGNTMWAWASSRQELAMAVLTDVAPGAEAMELRLRPGGPLDARVVDEAGKPFGESGTFYVLDEEGRVHNSASFDRGTLRTHVLPFDRGFDLLVHGSGGFSGRLDDVRAGSRDIVVQLRRVPGITGRVLRPDGSPARAGTIVRAMAVRSAVRIRPGISVVTQVGEDGRFLLPDLADLPFAVWAKPDDASRGTAPSPVVDGVLPGSDVLLRLREPVVVSGALMPAKAGRTLWLVPDGETQEHVEVRTDDQGRFRAPALAPGGYSVWLITPPDLWRRLGDVVAPSSDVTLTIPGR
jgi:hypothetical protein